MQELTMPRLAESMEEGTILCWLVPDGASVQTGQDLVEIETDKAVVSHASEAEGILAIVAMEGTRCPVGEVIARLGPDDGSVRAPAGVAPAARAAESPPARLPASSPPVEVVGKPTAARVSPLARRTATEHGIDITRVNGSGPNGRVTRRDVLATAGLEEAHPVVAGSTTAPQPAKADAPERIPLRAMQRVIARRMAESKATVPHFQVQAEVAVDALLSLRDRIDETQSDAAPTINDLIIKASALALRAHPLANGSYRDDGFILHEDINVGFAVSTDDGLLVPTVRAADRLGLGSIASETRRLTALVRDRAQGPADMEGGTFTVSNLGMFGMTAIYPVINMPQAAILGVGTARTILSLEQGQPVERSVMTLTLSCDHRILYGVDAARFLATIRDCLEQPMRLAL